MRRPTFTPEELEWIKKVDAELDTKPLTLADYEAADIIEDLLFPEKAGDKEKVRARHRAYYWAHRDDSLEHSRAYYEEHKEEIAARKARWYQENKAVINARQREYRIRAGQTRTPEQREADKLAHAEARKAKAQAEREARSEKYLKQLEYSRQYQLGYRAMKKGMTVEEYVAYQDAKKKAVESATADAGSEEERKKAYQKAYREAHKEELKAYQKAYYRKRRSGQQGAQPAAAM